MRVESYQESNVDVRPETRLNSRLVYRWTARRYDLV